MAKAKFPIMTLTQAAADRVRTLMAGHAIRGPARRGQERRLRRHVLYAGLCRGIGPYDEVIEDKGVKVIIDPKALMFLFGTEMDFQATSSVRASPSTTRTRRAPAAAANRSPSRRRAKRRSKKRAAPTPAERDKQVWDRLLVRSASCPALCRASTPRHSCNNCYKVTASPRGWPGQTRP